MLKQLINNARIEFTIIPIDPLLIKSGQATVAGVDMAFVRTYRRGGKEEPFIPGSSLKGLIRSYAEKICRTLKDDPVPVCLPYLKPGDEDDREQRQASCGLMLTKYKDKYTRDRVPSSTVYQVSCPICRMFGSHEFIGRCATSDAYLTTEYRDSGSPSLEIRNGVAIDRFTGGVAEGPFDLEVLSRGEFSTAIEIRNFERWQLGLLGLVLRDMEEGKLRIGFGKSKGLGKFKIEITQFGVTSYHQSMSTLTGIAENTSSEICNSYGFFHESAQNENALPLPAPSRQALSLRHEYDITEAWETHLTPAVEDFGQMIQDSDWPGPLEQLLERGA